MKKDNESIQVKRGSVVVRIYPTKSAVGYSSYQVADYSSGKRILRSFSDLKTAKEEAANIAEKLLAQG